MDYKIPKNQLLPFITNQNLYSGVEYVVGVAQNALEHSEKDFYKNVVDPFSAFFEVMTTGISSAEWMKKESARQVQKTIQNALGVFHQEILGNFKGWKSLGTGNIVDLVNDEMKIIAEVKNKHNTTKGNHKFAIYDNLENLLSQKYKGYIGYYVEVIPKSKKEYDKEFTPPDNNTGKQRPRNERIRVIDGKSFYDLASGQKDTIKDFYKVLPRVISDILKIDTKRMGKDEVFIDLFRKAYN